MTPLRVFLLSTAVTSVACMAEGRLGPELLALEDWDTTGSSNSGEGHSEGSRSDEASVQGALTSPSAAQPVGPGGRCWCDRDCAATEGFEPLCIHGVCGVLAIDSSCPDGSTAACPAGHRCWAGHGYGVCYPDYEEGRCAGVRDKDDSCWHGERLGCYRSCGRLCDLEGVPPGPSAEQGENQGAGNDTIPGCAYPDAPYGLAPGQVLEPMSWPRAIRGPGEDVMADLRLLHCAPRKHSLVFFVATTTCTSCPAQLTEIEGLRAHWEESGATFIFIVSDAASPEQANSYINRYGIDFGFRTNDADNSAGASHIDNLSSSVPWAALVRTADMQYIEDTDSSGTLDLRQRTSDLALDSSL